MMKKREDIGAYMEQWNNELKKELKQCVKAYEIKVKEYKELFEENKMLKKMLEK